MNDDALIFGASPRLRYETIALAAAFADDDEVAARVANLPLDCITVATRRFLFRAARGSRQTFGCVDDDSIYRLAARRGPEGSIGFYVDAMPRWTYAVVARPALVDEAVAWLRENASAA